MTTLSIYIKRFFIIALTLFILSSCTEEIDIKLRNDSKRLVLEGTLGIEPGVHTIILSRTLDYFESGYEMPYISDAVVSVTEIETGTVFILTENPNKPGHYETLPTVHAQPPGVKADNNQGNEQVKRPPAQKQADPSPPDNGLHHAGQVVVGNV